MSKSMNCDKEQTLFTVGQLAKKMSVTSRTVQYYDKEGLLKPKMKSASGRRLYSDEEVVKLYQIVTLKDLGFSLDEIKNQLPKLDTPRDVAKSLQTQMTSIDERIAKLQDQRRILAALEVEVLKGQGVDFTRYADIITSLQMSNEFYWAITHIGDDLLNQLRGSGIHDEVFLGFGSAKGMIDQMEALRVKALRMLDGGADPNSAEGQELGRAWWEISMQLVGNDVKLLSKLSAAVEAAMSERPELSAAHARSLEFIGPALHAYFLNSVDAEAIAAAEEMSAHL